MTYPKYGSESIYDIDSYDGIRDGVNSWAGSAENLRKL